MNGHRYRGAGRARPGGNATAARKTPRVGLVSIAGCALAGIALASLAGAGVIGAATSNITLTPTKTYSDTSTVSQSTASDGRSDCGGVTLLKDDGSAWTCTFDDEFDGAALDPTKWNVVQTAVDGYHSGKECDEDDPDNVFVSDGALHLVTLKTAAPFECHTPQKGPYQTQYTSGMVTTDGTFSQTYGMFEAKAAFPAATVKGLQSSLWLWPVNATAYGPIWPDSGEIDFAEWYSEYSNRIIPVVHYNAQNLDPSRTNNNCYVSDTTGYNTYAVIWTPDTITVQIDGQTCVVDSWRPGAPQKKPEPFNLPFYVNLTTELGINTNQFNGTAPLPAETSIDWVRAWS
jgi:beta-glucanase (GH16 family)